ncbi:MAG: DUF4493 domain-containing protein [Muribaculaceae bacterium]|nr:DUF4493 domain-containing protein [Muribaculaceae bacterium]
MMKKLLFGVFAASGLLIFPACSDTFDPSGDGRQGRILPSVDLDKEVAAPRAKAKSRAGGAPTEIGVDDLILKLTHSSGQSYSFGVNEFPNNQDFPVGDYTFEASYGQSSDEGFEKPWYYGSTALTVLENRTTPVSLTANLANAMVTVQYSEAVKQYFADYTAEVKSSTGATFSYAADETRAVYVTPGTVDINVSVTKQNGVSARLNPCSFTAEARHHYIVTFDVNNGEVGSASLVITFYEELDEQTVEIDLSDQILTAPAPTVTASGFVSGEALELIEGTVPENKLRATVMAPGGLKTVVLTTQSASLIRQGWPAEVDFASTDAATLAKLRELGLEFPGLEGTYSKMALLDFTSVIAHIGHLAAADNTTTFTIVAKDNLMKASEPATVLSVNIEKLDVTVNEIDPLYIDDAILSFTLDYNGANPADEIKVQIKNDRGTFTNVPVEFSATSRAAATYRADVTVPANDSDITFRVVAGDIVTDAITVKRVEPTHELAVSENNIFATNAYVEVRSLDGSDVASALGGAKIFTSTDGVNYTEATAAVAESAYLHVAGLKAGATNYVKAEINGLKTRPVSFTTEQATQIPNSDMETWSSHSKNSGATKYTVWESATPWATLNVLTNSSLSAIANYCGGSGTVPTDDAHTGKAALIRTLGWKRAALWNNPSNFTAGELYVGTYANGTANYGIDFSTRPAALKFFYKYTARNSGENGYVEISVLDASGNSIATATRSLIPADSYQQETIALAYSPNMPKAASVKVIFKSTDTDRYLNNNGVEKVNEESGINLGSQLYVDDIELEY